MIQPSLKASLAQLQALATYLDQGGSNASFIFYDDTKPASVSVAANNAAKLVILTLPKPCLKTMHADRIELNQTDAAVVTKDGIATWARLLNGAGEPVADFTVGANITIANPELKAGGTLMMNSLILKPST
ncbi:hypothetical protein ACVIAJ_07050 [Acinetobacter johnsonii]|uniref:Uncharacterized protein n=1 Tax=Acinetobacter johnsonii TaxID=40214 RepID=A0A1R7Q9A3_ACIJO|nr:hypothetical protein [Acinetobacter johnsonii]SJX20848.1 hypothetical protein ACNJC6_00446 [Acinetobacter johnsonii]